MSFSAPYGLGLQGDDNAMMAEVFSPEHFYPTTLFTPLNPRPPMRFVNPNVVLHYPDNDPSLYDMPRDDDFEALNEAPEQPVKKCKRPPTQARQGREVSLGAVWNYMDEEDVVFESEGKPEVLVPSKPAKRAKSAPAKKTEARRTPYKIQNSEPEENDGEQPMNSQLRTPPDNTKGKSKKSRAATSKGKKGRLPSFKNLTITKGIEPQQKEDKESIETPSAVISYQGWISTQDSMKHVTLMQTTLDKLASFRYNPTPSKPIPTPIPIFHEIRLQERVEDTEQAPISTNFEGNDVLSNGGVFTQAAWNTEADDRFVTEPAPGHPQHENVPAEHDQEMEVIDHREVDTKVSPVSNTGQPAVRLDEYVLQLSTACEPQTHEAYQHNEPLVSNKIQDPVHVDSESFQYQRELSAVTAIIPEVRTFAQEQDAQISGESDIEVNASSSENPVPKLSTGCDLDEFDDGLNEDDLMAIVSDELTLNEPTVAVLPSGVKPSSPMVQTNLDLPNVPHLPSINMDSDDDEYPMDAGEGDRMLELSEHPDLVVEKHHALSSLQHEIDFQNEYDSSLQFLPPSPGAKPQQPANIRSDLLSPIHPQGNDSQDEFEDWTFMNTELNDVMRKAEVQKAPTTVILSQSQITDHFQAPSPKIKVNPKAAALILDDSHEYTPLDRFARPDFPSIVRDRCPVVGVSAQSFLRVCFRIGELFKEGARCSAAGQDAVIEFFARVNFSSREAGTTKQHFRFMDLWSEHPPFPTGILANYKSSSLADSESLFFVGDMGKGEMVRCLGRLKKEKKSDTGWIFEIINVRGTDWEEIRWTKRIVDAGAEIGLSKL